MTNTKLTVPNKMLGKLWRAIIEFNMISNGDKILLGLSGGKDSMYLAAALATIKRYAPVKFELACFTVDTMFTPDFPKTELKTFCENLGLEFYHEKVNVMEVWETKNLGNTPCFSCAYFRRAATNRKALELGFNKIALAHHHDDAVETFLLNLIQSGQLQTFLPVTYLSKTKLTVLRPLVYYREQEIIANVKALNIIPLKNACPYDGNTKRQATKEHIASLKTLNPEAYEHLGAAMRTSDKQELWPTPLKQKELTHNFRTFWKKGNTKS